MTTTANIDPSYIDALKIELKTYDDVTESIKRRKQRILACNPNAKSNTDDAVKALTKIKDSTGRLIVKFAEEWDVWSEWLANVPGVGPYVGGNLIMLYYYRHVPICDCGHAVAKKKHTFYCDHCQESIKGGGLLNFKIEERDFPTVSKWWAYMGREIRDGKLRCRKKGELANWSQLGRQIGYQFGEQVNRQKADSPYKAFMLERKARRERTHPDASKGHRHNMAKNETIKLFLSHFWHVARTLDGKDTRGPYAEVVLKHDGIIPPYYWTEPTAIKRKVA